VTLSYDGFIIVGVSDSGWRRREGDTGDGGGGGARVVRAVARVAGASPSGAVD
jgi:hypothetical protein